MQKKWYFYTSLTIVVAFLSSGFKASKLDSKHWFLIGETDVADYLYPSQEQDDSSYVSIPFTGNFFIGFKEAIGLKESQGKYKKVNTLGYLGKYQFGIETLKTVGINNRRLFLDSPALQEKAFVALLAKNKFLLKDIIDRYEGTLMNGIRVTESGILAAAHLGGAGSVKKYFRNNGKRYFRDAYGTSIRSYMEDFGGYDTSFIVADNNAKV
jgi:hypothetical protein